MTGFADYKARAVTLPQRLAESYRVPYGASSSAPPDAAAVYGFFTKLLPAETEISMQTYARMIALAAEVLDVDDTCTDAAKIQILKGMYCYVFSAHDTTIGWITRGPLLLLLKEHLGVDSPARLPQEERRQIFKALGDWCEALFQAMSPETQEMRSLRLLIPVDMRATVYTMETAASVGRYGPGLPGPSECLTWTQDTVTTGMRALFS